MINVIDLMELSMDAEQTVREAVAEFMEHWTEPLARAQMVKQMLAQGFPTDDADPAHVELARRAAKLARGEMTEE